MKLIEELIKFAWQRNMLTEEHKQQLQRDGFYKFFHERTPEYLWADEFDDRYGDYQEDFENRREEEIDRTYYDDFYHPGKRFGRRHHGGGGKANKVKKTELEFSDLEKRVQAAFKKWDKSREPLVQAVSFLANHGMNAQGRDLSNWQNASNWLFEVKEQKLFEVVSKLDVTQILNFTQICSRLTWQKLREQLVEPIQLCSGDCVASYKELIKGANEALSESAQNMIQNDLFAQVYRLAEGWSKIC